MTYKPHDLIVLTRESLADKLGYEPEGEELLTYYDNRNDARVPLPCVALPHSCSEWVIGGAAEVRAMIADLTAILPSLEQEKKP